MVCAWSALSHYLNQCRNIVNWTLRNILQWNINQNSYIFIKKSFENVFCKMSVIFYRPQCVKPYHTTYCILLIMSCAFRTHLVNIVTCTPSSKKPTRHEALQSAGAVTASSQRSISLLNIHWKCVSSPRRPEEVVPNTSSLNMNVSWLAATRCWLLWVLLNTA